MSLFKSCCETKSAMLETILFVPCLLGYLIAAITYGCLYVKPGKEESPTMQFVWKYPSYSNDFKNNSDPWITRHEWPAAGSAAASEHKLNLEVFLGFALAWPCLVYLFGLTCFRTLKYKKIGINGEATDLDGSNTYKQVYNSNDRRPKVREMIVNDIVDAPKEGAFHPTHRAEFVLHFAARLVLEPLLLITLVFTLGENSGAAALACAGVAVSYVLCLFAGDFATSMMQIRSKGEYISYGTVGSVWFNVPLVIIPAFLLCIIGMVVIWPANAHTTRSTENPKPQLPGDVKGIVVAYCVDKFFTACSHLFNVFYMSVKDKDKPSDFWFIFASFVCHWSLMCNTFVFPFMLGRKLYNGGDL